MEPTQMTLLDNSTICAISTAPGVGGIAVARVSGPEAIACVARIWHGKNLSEVDSHTAHLGTISDVDGSILDQAVVTLFRAPRSFTGEEVVEIAVHGSRFVQRQLLQSLVAAGCRLAEAGEFTRRAFTNGRLDLAEAEAVADVIASNSRAAHRIAISQMRGGFSRRLASLRQQLVDLASLLELELDFSEEEVEFASRQKLSLLAVDITAEVSRLYRSFAGGQAIKDGIPVAIVGATNAGKSSLLNALLGDDRAIVSDIHGTTRDTIEETLEIGDFLFRFIDTAGLRSTTDTIEQIGIQRSLQAIDKARIVIVVADATAPLDINTLNLAIDKVNAADAYLLLALNKTDISQSVIDAHQAITALANPARGAVCPISALTGHGIDQLRDQLQQFAADQRGDADEDILVTNARHAQALSQALDSAHRVCQALSDNLPGDLIAQDLRETIHHLATITGDIPSTEILATIFSRFCIGK
jgi:tRNA modification GTPase